MITIKTLVLSAVLGFLLAVGAAAQQQEERTFPEDNVKAAAEAPSADATRIIPPEKTSVILKQKAKDAKQHLENAKQHIENVKQHADNLKMRHEEKKEAAADAAKPKGTAATGEKQ
jgi:molecular chaperone GrpE (heat shock protein)